MSTPVIENFEFTLYFEENFSNEQIIPTNFTTYSNTQTPTPTYYTKNPNMENGKYIPPTYQDMFQTGNLYNETELFLIMVYNVGALVPSNFQMDNSIPLTGTQISLFRYTYSLSKTDFTKSFQYNLLDLLYLQNNLFQTYSDSFLSSSPCLTTVRSLLSLIRIYCNISSNMEGLLCSSMFLPFSNIKYTGTELNTSQISQSPCTLNFNDCSDGWKSFCGLKYDYTDTGTGCKITDGLETLSNVNVMNCKIACNEDTKYKGFAFDSSTNSCTLSSTTCPSGSSDDSSTFYEKNNSSTEDLYPNYQSQLCQNFYNGSYGTNGEMQMNARSVLETACQDIYNSTEDKSTLDDVYQSYCGCYLPYTVYEEFRNTYSLPPESIGPNQCWYLPCISSSFPPYEISKQSCPTSTISNCIQTTYVTLSDSDGGNIEKNNITVNQSIKNCKATENTDKQPQDTSTTASQRINKIKNKFKIPDQTGSSPSSGTTVVPTKVSFQFNMAIVVLVVVLLFLSGVIAACCIRINKI